MWPVPDTTGSQIEKGNLRGTISGRRHEHLLRGLLNATSAAGRVVSACDRREVLLLLNKAVLGEYRYILNQPELVERFPQLTIERADESLRRLRYVGDIFDSLPAAFDYPRDPRDAKFIELAIAGRATHLITGDHDLLALGSDHSAAAKRFRQQAPHTAVLTPVSFLDLLDAQTTR
jgi:putative PIN family toxin of toxin-antitoxin system